MGARAGGAGMGSRGGGLARALSVAESSIRDRAVENAYIFDAQGNEVWRRIEGEMHQMSSNPKVNELMNRLAQNSRRVSIPSDKMLNNIVTHNHPGSPMNSLSDGDVLGAIRGNAKEIRAVTSGFTFSMKRPRGGWGKIDATKLGQAFTASLKQTKDTHKTWTALSKQFGLNYTATPR